MKFKLNCGTENYWGVMEYLYDKGKELEVEIDTIDEIDKILSAYKEAYVPDIVQEDFIFEREVIMNMKEHTILIHDGWWQYDKAK